MDRDRQGWGGGRGITSQELGLAVPVPQGGERDPDEPGGEDRL